MTDRRAFLKTLAGTAPAILLNPFPVLSAEINHAEPVDIGEVRSLDIRCVSETGWFDTGIIAGDVRKAGGPGINQYGIPFTAENSGGYSALITVENLNGNKSRYLLDSGWGNDWMDYAFRKSGVDAYLEQNRIKGLILSHDHNDHFWGIESTLKHCPDIPLYYPATFHKKSINLLDGADYSSVPGNPRNRFPHKGPRTPVKPGELCMLQPGFAVVDFDVDIPLGVRGECAIYVKVKDKGYVVITGCGHPGICSLFDFAAARLKGGQNIYGCYGGLHIAPFERWEPRMQASIECMKDAGIKKVACNHCTGRIWVEKAMNAGLPVVQGTDAFRSYYRISTAALKGGANPYIGNGDSIVF
ncbi:MAG TPA: MBL fold metallo-hydrolase [Desulfovibrio sp.]|nr:MBL fold metallo-hydrolase [Desulfovibrio sp.]